MLFLDGYAGDAPGPLDIRSQGYGEDSDLHGLTHADVLEDENTAFVWTKWQPLELWGGLKNGDVSNCSNQEREVFR